MFLNVHVLCLATEKRVLGMKPRAVVYTDGVNTSMGEAKWSISLALFPYLVNGKRSIFSIPVSLHSFHVTSW